MKLMNMKGNGLLILVVLLEHTGLSFYIFHSIPIFFLSLFWLLIYFLFSTLTTDVVPSFILLAIQGSKVVTYVYELHGDQVDVSKSEFSKA